MYAHSLESPGIPPSETGTECPSSSLKRGCLCRKEARGGSLGDEVGGSSPEHVVVAVYLLTHVGVVQDAPIAHHSTADALGAPSREAGQEQLLLGHWGEACHHLLHH